jgi:hypothetical protein
MLSSIINNSSFILNQKEAQATLEKSGNRYKMVIVKIEKRKETTPSFDNARRCMQLDPSRVRAPCACICASAKVMLVLCNSYMYTRVKRESNVCVFVQQVDLGYRVIDDGDDSKVVSVRYVGVVIAPRLYDRVLAPARVEESS